MCVLGLGVHSSLCPHRHGLTEAGKALENHGIQALTTTPALVSTAPGSTSTLDAGSFLLLAPGNPHLAVWVSSSPLWVILGFSAPAAPLCSPAELLTHLKHSGASTPSLNLSGLCHMLLSLCFMTFN